MSQIWVPATFARGGTSKGLFFHNRDLPADQQERGRLFLDALGSPDPFGRQLDGMGGGISSLSKVMVVGPPTRDDADVDYTFGQVAVDRTTVDLSANCGNLSSAVGPFAVDEGVVDVDDGETVLRLHNTNTAKIIVSRFTVRGGVTETSGTARQPGVPGCGAPVELTFLDPAGSRTGLLLPTGRVCDELKTPSGSAMASLIDVSNPLVMVAAGAVGLTGAELPDDLDSRGVLMGRLDEIRRAAGVAMGIASAPEGVPLAVPKIALVGAPSTYTALDNSITPASSFDLAVRIVSMERVHRAVTGTGALGLAAASRIPGSVAATATTSDGEDVDPAGLVRLGTPAGVLTVAADVDRTSAGGWAVRSASLIRTARPLMRGSVAVRGGPAQQYGG